ncbi:MAG TPA: InlB B-repeat-containing protein [Candidatus Borkfalkia stercoripullorum]|nr:InlB B-repeat-containing protein [Candidatus Borkfalkia stercoripullorum]
MKKLTASIMAMILAGVSILGISGCDIKTSHDYFISDGDFVYIDMSNFGPANEPKEEDCYAIVGTNPQGLKEDIYVPAYYKDKVVRYTWIEENWTFAENRFGLNVTGANSVYYPYTHRVFTRIVGGYVAIHDLTSKIPEYCYFVNGTEEYSQSIRLKNYYMYKSWYTYDGGRKGNYVTRNLYLAEKEQMEEDSCDLTEINGYRLWVKGYDQFLQIANTSYMFNYEGEPNEGYFFINDFERGGLIEDTPYEPRREGYTFAGWYKEPECVNAWDFSKDTLPVAEYDEEGNLLFVETKLYAKWNIAV